MYDISFRMWHWINNLVPKFRRIDWRVRALIGAILAVLIPTIVVYASGAGLNPSTHFGAIFASWVSGVALFIVAAVGTLASFARPELESFDARARILFRRQTGNHIDYIVSKITDVLEHYAELTIITITVQDYDDTEKKFRVLSVSEITVRSYLDDVSTTYNSSYDLREVTPPPAGGQPNRLVYLRVDDEPIGKSEEFATQISRSLSCSIARDSSCKVSRVTEHWVLADTEANNHKPKRYTQQLVLKFENLTKSGQDIVIGVAGNGTELINETLIHGKLRTILEIRDVKPGDLAYEFHILQPAS